MYKSLSKSDFLDYLKIDENQVPNSLIIYGGYNPPQTILNWCAQAPYKKENFFYPLSIRDNIAVTWVYGDAMASEVAHIFSVIGVKQIILIGTYGALQTGVRFGEIFIPNLAIGEDGATRCYNSKLNSEPDKKLFLKAKEIWSDYTIHEGPIVSTACMLAETQEIIDDWVGKGYCGVDLETSAVFSVAKHF